MTVSIALAALPLLAVACVTDVRRRLIPNWTAGGAAAVGGVAALASGTGLEALGAGLLCLGLGSAAAWPGMWGWGDAKLLGGAGVVAGLSGALMLLLATALIGALLALSLMAARPFARVRPGLPRWLRAELRRLRCAPTVPYAVAITGGLAVALFV